VQLTQIIRGEILYCGFFKTVAKKELISCLLDCSNLSVPYVTESPLPLPQNSPKEKIESLYRKLVKISTSFPNHKQPAKGACIFGLKQLATW